MSNIELLAKLEETAYRLKTLSGDIPSMIELSKSLMECAKFLGLQMTEFHNCDELLIYILSKICDSECAYPNQNHPFWKFRLNDERCYGEFDTSKRSDKEFVEFKDSYLENLRTEIDAQFKSFEDQCPIAELESLKKQFDEFFQKYNEITQHHNCSLSSLGSDNEVLVSLREIHDFFCNFDSIFSQYQEKIILLKDAVFNWGNEKENTMEFTFDSFIDSGLEQDEKFESTVFGNEHEYGDLFKLQKVQRTMAGKLFGKFFVNNQAIYLNFLEDYDDFKKDKAEILGWIS